MPEKLSVADRACLTEHSVTYLGALFALVGPEVLLLPKHHLWRHMCEDGAGGEQLNPLFTSTWMDESYNHHIAGIARSVHGATAELSTLEKLHAA